MTTASKRFNIKQMDIKRSERVRYRGALRERRALAAYVKLMRAAESVTGRIHQGLGREGLTLSQFGVLEALYHLGPLSQAELAKKILRTGGNITMVTDNLEARGLVLRRRDTGDRRRYSVALTPEGSSLVARFFPAHAGRIVEELSVLTCEEQETLARLCRKLGLGHQQQKGVSHSGG